MFIWLRRRSYSERTRNGQMSKLMKWAWERKSWSRLEKVAGRSSGSSGEALLKEVLLTLWFFTAWSRNWPQSGRQALAQLLAEIGHLSQPNTYLTGRWSFTQMALVHTSWRSVGWSTTTSSTRQSAWSSKGKANGSNHTIRRFTNTSFLMESMSWWGLALK